MGRNAFLFAVLCCVWGLTFLPVRIATEHVPPILFAAARFVIAAVLMLGLAGREAWRVPRAVWPRLVWTGLLVNSLSYAFLFWGMAHAPSGLAAIVNMSTIPLYTLLATRVIEGQPITPAKLAAIALGVAGLAFLFATRASGGMNSASGDPFEFLGLVAVATGTLFYCVGAVLTRPLARQVPTQVLAGWQTVVGACGLILLSLPLERPGAAELAALLSRPVWPALGFVVLAGSIVGFRVYLVLLRDWGAFRAGLYAFVSPAIAVGAGVLALGEPFGWTEGLGAVLMFAAAAIAIRR